LQSSETKIFLIGMRGNYGWIWAQVLRFENLINEKNFMTIKRLDVKKIVDQLMLIVSSAWVGGMWAIGFIAAPVLFQTLTDKAMAGTLAGKMFSVTAYLGMVSAALLLAYFYTRFTRQMLRHGVVWVVICMLLLVMLGHLGLQPVIAQLRIDARWRTDSGLCMV
jgi:Domain of unknown function (DUF4149)